MKWGIVGSEAAKFTPQGEQRARAAIRQLLQPGDEVISGGCHLGGIDIWAAEIGRALGLSVTEFLPTYHTWPYYKERNIQIATACETCVCITVRQLPSTYSDLTFDRCYHCQTDAHVKSGGCWTMKWAQRVLGRQTQLIVIDNDGEEA